MIDKKNKEGKPIDKEAVRVLAIELGAREAARRLGLNEDTVCSWSRRFKWDLPKRKPGAFTQASKSQAAVGDLVLADHKQLEERGKTAIAKASVKSAEAHEALPIPHPQALNLLAGAMAKVFGWQANNSTNISVTGDKVLVVCDEGRRQELIEQRKRLMGEKQVEGHEVTT